MTFLHAIETNFSKYSTFSGRAPRAEFWWWQLFYFLVSIVIASIEPILVGAGLRPGILTTLVGLALLLPTLAVYVRRLHDVDRSGWWLLICLTGIGGLFIFYWSVIKGTTGSNTFGSDPLGG